MSEFWQNKQQWDHQACFGLLAKRSTVCKYMPGVNELTGALPPSPDWIFA